MSRITDILHDAIKNLMFEGFFNFENPLNTFHHLPRNLEIQVIIHLISKPTIGRVLVARESGLIIKGYVL